MLRDITIGQYYTADSVLHRLDPRVKLAGTIMFIISLFVSDHPLLYTGAGLFLVLAVLLSKVPVRFIFKGLKSILVLLFMTVLFNLFLTPGETVLQVWKLTITDKGIVVAISMGLRLIMLITGSSIMTLTTTPNLLTAGMSKALSPLKAIKLPVDEVAMMMAIALRFIPILVEETSIIMKAQEARGASFNEGSIIKRAKALLPILVPLFVSAFRRADDLAMAMESRCYCCGQPRTLMKPLAYHKRDAVAYLVLFLYLGGMIAYAVYLKPPL